MLQKLPRNLSNTRVLLPRGEDANPELERELADRGAEVVSLVLYRKVALPYDRELDQSIATASLVAFCATSPSAARWLFGGAGEKAQEYLRRTPAIALGRATRGTIAASRVSRVEIAQPPTFERVARIAAGLAVRASGA
jgi:uroporphyrinogen-III synthase